MRGLEERTPLSVKRLLKGRGFHGRKARLGALRRGRVRSRGGARGKGDETETYKACARGQTQHTGDPQLGGGPPLKNPRKSSAPNAPTAADKKGGKTNAGTVASKWQGARGAPKPLAPGLYVTATPIGNLGDITLRALEILEGAHAVACEDTRVTGKLLTAFGIKAELFAYHDHNAARARPKILARLAEGDAIALVSDAGTPLISDPGFKLVSEAREAGYAIHVVPGASSIAAALSVAGLPTDKFLFAGFLPNKAGARKKAFEDLKPVPASLVLLEAPSRLEATLRAGAEVLGDRNVAVARELTKIHEEVRRGTLAGLADQYTEEGPPKGEIVIVIAPPTESTATAIDIDDALRLALEAGSVKDAASEVAEMTGRPRREIYARALELTKESK